MSVHIHGLSKKFISLRRTVDAVRDINISLDPKEFFVLLGPSGCGKSTLLNCIAGIEKPTDGEIRFGNTVFFSARKKIFLPPRSRNAAMVFQNYALYPHLNVFDNIAFPLRIQKMNKQDIEHAVYKTAEIMHISNLLRAKPSELSGGQQQRTAIARAIVRKPDLFLLDEPLSNLDAQLRTSTRGELKNLQRALGIPAVYVTHDQTEAMTLGDRIAVMLDGSISQIGTPADLYAKPANSFIASFIGSPPMNLLKGFLKKENGTDIFQSDQHHFNFSTRGEKRDIPCGSVILGIRPENITVCAESEKLNKEKTVNDLPENMITIKAVISVCEPLGRENLIHVRLGDQIISVLTAKKKFHPGDSVLICFYSADIHYFKN